MREVYLIAIVFTCVKRIRNFTFLFLKLGHSLQLATQSEKLTLPPNPAREHFFDQSVGILSQLATSFCVNLQKHVTGKASRSKVPQLKGFWVALGELNSRALAGIPRFGNSIQLFTTLNQLLSFRYSLKSSIAEAKCLATSPYRWQGYTYRNAIVVRLHAD